MLAIDTNVVVRYLTDDHSRQSAKAKAIIEGEDVFVATTVLLETEWVLCSVYGLPADRVVNRLMAFAGLAHVTLEKPAQAAQALAWAQQGIDLADALHLAGAEGCEAFVTFDREFARRANAIGGITARAL
jgi:predicted nucleic-acid-binding protein